MLSGHRAATIALGLALLALPALAQETQQPALESQPVAQPRQEQGAAARDDDGGTASQSPDSIFFVLQGIEAAIRDLIAEEDKIKREGEIQREIDDLRAQQEMAVWAEKMAWATIGSLILTAIALWAIVRTLHHTRRAADYANDMVDEAKKATEAANRTIAETTRIGEAQLRPWLLFDLSLHKEVPFDNNAGLALVVDFKIKNHGKSPAFDIDFMADVVQPWTEVDHSKGLRKFCEDCLGMSAGYGSELPPGPEPIIKPFNFNARREFWEERVFDGIAQRISVVAYGCVIYNDPAVTRTYVAGKAVLVRAIRNKAPEGKHRNYTASIDEVIASIAFDKPAGV